MKVLFINQHTGSRTVPLASACLASALETKFGDGVECPIMELAPNFDLRETLADILSHAPDILALTVYSWSREPLLELASAVSGTEAGESAGPAGGTKPAGKTRASEKAVRTGPLVIAGGPEVSADPASVQAHLAVDLAVSGEGEEAVVRIAEACRDGEPGLSGLPAPLVALPIRNLDSLPSPWDARDLAGREWDDYVWELTRGCPFACHFCFESKGTGGVRHKSIRRAGDELAQLKGRNAGRIFLLDPTFNAPPARAVELLGLFLDSAPDIAWHLEIRSEFLDEDQADLCAELGCTLQIGLQTADEEVARGIGRPFSREDFSGKVLLLHERGVPYGLDLIWGLPGDSLGGFRRSLDFALGCAPNHIDLFPLSILPGTKLADDAGDRDLPHRPAPPYTVTGNRDFPAEDLAAAARLAAAADELYNRGRAVPWFLTACDALDLGPVEMIDEWAAAGPDGFFGPGEFIGRLAETQGRDGIGNVLADMVNLFSLESGLREGLDLPETASFSRSPHALMDHLDMGIGDPEELAAFISEDPGTWLVRNNDGELGLEKVSP